MGPISPSGNTEDELVSFTGSHYTDPLLTWPDPIAVTDIEFLESSSLGERSPIMYLSGIAIMEIYTTLK